MSPPVTRRHTPRRLSWWSVTWLTVVWVLLWGNPSPVVLAGGVLTAVLVLVVFPLPRVRVRLRLKPWAFAVLVTRFLADVVVASFQVAWLTVRPGRPVRGVVMDLELAGDDELLQTITAEMTALVPGTVVIDLEPSERLLTLHALDVTTPRQAKAVRRRVLAQEARVLRAFDPRAEQLLNPRTRKEPR
ncbi:Na+/H+ antiporter subunit E [Ornithinimicrobium sp. W1679]|uniref:Na+/H+ antiporter subunit E n=1 Tax=Ornithinimicrobium sp. W1679 TaxID=3418770 RepID=UPI003CF9202D